MRLTSILSYGTVKTADPQSVGLLALAVFCAVVPLEITHLLCMLMGATGYLALQTLNPKVERKSSSKKPLPNSHGNLCQVPAASADRTNRRPQRTGPYGAAHSIPGWSQGQTARSSAWQSHQGGAGHGFGAGGSERGLVWPGCSSPAPTTPKQPQVRKASAVPVLAPAFKAHGFEAEVNELLQQITPTPEGDVVVTQLARLVKQHISAVMPEAEVSGFATGNFMGSCTAFGVAVPEVDIIVNMSPNALFGRIQDRWSTVRSAAKLDARKLQKSAIRACTDRLVGFGGFKFRRSTFRGQEPKVILVAPASLGLCEHAVPISVSVNGVTPLYNAALLAECGQLEARAKSLLLLVKRWAKDRGLCHVSQGHLSTYAWTLLSIYFLQVVGDDQGPLLPSLEGFSATKALMKKGAAPVAVTKSTTEEPAAADLSQQTVPKEGRRQSVAELFKKFVRFYCQSSTMAGGFDWRNEAVSIRLAKRAPPDLELPLHIALSEDGTVSEVAPSIEDPFEVGRNLSASMTVGSVTRLHEEFQRALNICDEEETSLTRLLEPWSPPGPEENQKDGENDE